MILRVRTLGAGVLDGERLEDDAVDALFQGFPAEECCRAADLHHGGWRLRWWLPALVWVAQVRFHEGGQTLWDPMGRGPLRWHAIVGLGVG
jgi:hypothetical protein